jgi:four helix bundle protein
MNPRSRFSVLSSRFVFRFGSKFELRGSGFGVRGSGFAVRGLGRPQNLPGHSSRRLALSDRFTPDCSGSPINLDGTADAPYRRMGVRRFTDLRAWQACDAYKKAVYKLRDSQPPLLKWRRWCQFEDSVAGPPAHLSEGFGRFSPPDFARYCVIARASLMESQNHLIDAVDSAYMTDDMRAELNALAEIALEEVTGLMEYLQSPEALRNARKARERRIASRSNRQPPNRQPERGTANPEPGTPNPEPRTRNPEPGTPNPKPRTRNPEPRTRNRT